jgi:3-oxoacyl-[acyl-carrier-protein] synthase II
MPVNRVVITGMGAISPFGRGVDTLLDGFLQGRSGIRILPELDEIGGLRTRVAGLVPELDAKEIPRKFRRSMSNMSIYAILACQEALASAGLSTEACADGKTGVSIGSTVGSTRATEDFFVDYLSDHSLERMKSTLFFQIMNHSCAANVAQTLGIAGRILAPSAACATGCQAIGYGFEMIAAGKQERMLCGGADEFHSLTAGTFDIMTAASVNFNDRPQQTPRPFDRTRDGVVCAEGSGILLLESLDAALARGATILAEIAGFATTSDSASIANPNSAALETCMRAALADAAMAAEDIDYVNAHATATQQGDIAEGQAISRIFGEKVPVSGLKGHLGHTMAASGSLELVATVQMLRGGFLIPTLNLDDPDPACGPLRHVRQVEGARLRAAVKNNFALGGVNSSIVVRSFA